MIPLNELREGVWVSEGSTMLQVSLSNGDFWHSDQFDPIPLTPEILEKAGFESRVLGVFDFDRNMNLRITGSEYDYNGIWIGEVKYVHQLQNLYFALTGEELNIQL